MLSFILLQLVRRYTGGHKGSISCLMTFMASSGEVMFSFSSFHCIFHFLDLLSGLKSLFIFGLYARVIRTV